MDGEEEDGGRVLTLDEALRMAGPNLEGLREEAREGARVWGGFERSRTEECTHEDGYIAQKINLCRSCTEVEQRPVAVCVGCSLSCHLEHDILELWSKPSIRCDCGSGTSPACKLRALEPTVALNTENTYVPAHNFTGLFCWCRRPYQYEDDVVMIQCCICSDWFHDSCVTADMNHSLKIDDEVLDQSLFVCRDCCTPSLARYRPLLGWIPPPAQVTGAEIQVAAHDGREHHGTCLAPTVSGERSSGFWKPSMRENICRCEKCTQAYTSEGIANVLQDFNGSDGDDDDDDEGDDNEDHPDDLDAAVAKMPHEGQIRAAAAYDHMRSALRHVLETALSSGKRVIDDEEVARFKEELQKRSKH